MPTLNWLSKDKVVNYAAKVPVHALNHRYNFGGTSGNNIIHGDNLTTLKSLLPLYECRVKCIYIDPWYNTGNEGEYLTRHDKWLCMMYPRLKLLKQLLDDDGAIFISIDDNEVAALKFICDEIFGSQNFVCNVIWRTSDNSNNDSKKISVDHNSTMTYSKNMSWQPNKLVYTKKQSHFKNPDNNPRGAYFDGNPLNSPNTRPNLCYEIESPTGLKIQPPTNGWRWSR